MITKTAETDLSSLMLPPRKILRRGSRELDCAVRKGEVELSLPQPNWARWISPSSYGNDDQSPGLGGSGDEGLVYAGVQPLCGVAVAKNGCATKNCTEALDHASGDGTKPDSVKTGCMDLVKGIHTLTPLDEDTTRVSTAMQTPRLPRFHDIIGHAAVKLRLDEILLPLALPAELADSILTGVRSLPASVLLFGPPGCGKTQLAKAIAGEAQASFLSVGPSDILSKFVGESEASIRSLFIQANNQAQLVDSRCAVLFFDEIDALGQSRGGSVRSNRTEQGSSDTSSRRLLAELLIQLNQINTAGREGDSTSDSRAIAEDFNLFKDNAIDKDSAELECETQSITRDGKGRARVIVVAATNRPEDCDAALLRRFSVRVQVSLPNMRDRKRLLTRYLIDIDHAVTPNQLLELSRYTEGWSGSDIESLAREGTMAPVRECIRSAALMKRRTNRIEQRVGDSTNQDSLKIGRFAHEGSRERLLKRFANLRPVSMQDFQDAIDFLTSNTGTARSGTVVPVDFETGRGKHRTTHYDSSSDEED